MPELRIINPSPVHAELVEALFFTLGLGAKPKENGRSFDKLRTDGHLVASVAREGMIRRRKGN